MSSQKASELVGLQKKEGSFVLSEDLGHCIGVRQDSIEAAANKKNWDMNAFATIMAVSYCQTKLNDVKDGWGAQMEKAKLWLIRYHKAAMDEMYDAALMLML